MHKVHINTVSNALVITCYAIDCSLHGPIAGPCCGAINSPETRKENDMTLEQIKGAIALGLSVKWSNDGYDVIQDSLGQYLIKYRPNGHCIGLTRSDGITMNGEESQFYVART